MTPRTSTENRLSANISLCNGKEMYSENLQFLRSFKHCQKGERCFFSPGNKYSAVYFDVFYIMIYWIAFIFSTYTDIL